jgi:hypothetical protein
MPCGTTGTNSRQSSLTTKRTRTSRIRSAPLMSNYNQPHNAKIAEGDFINPFETLGPRKLARKLGYKNVRSVLRDEKQ